MKGGSFRASLLDIFSCWATIYLFVHFSVMFTGLYTIGLVSIGFLAWAEQERAGNLAWIVVNLHPLWPAAQAAYGIVGNLKVLSPVRLLV
jgi:hypothetical protein